MLKAGLGRADITPEKGVALVGYFNPRYNQGKLDDLNVRVLLLEKNQVKLAIVSCDLCFVTGEMVTAVRHELAETPAAEFADHLLLAATHTHTGPYVTPGLLGGFTDDAYMAELPRRIGQAIRDAVADLAPATLEFADTFDNPYAYNRRYWMKNGTVVTNPGKRNPAIVRPEGPVDDEISLLAVRRAGKPDAFITNIVNHTDTTGGDYVSADWPGFLERKVRELTRSDAMVMTLIGCSGNINHFDVSDGGDQTTPAEARRIGEGYGEILGGLMKKLTPLEFETMTVKRGFVTIPYRTITPAMLAAAEKTVEQTQGAAADGDMTSEGLASGLGAVARWFAEQTVEYAHCCSGKSRDFELYAVNFDDKFAIASLPGEPFTQIGQAIKTGSPAAHTMVTSLAMGECGYVCLPGCYERGGYEILPVVGGGPATDTAGRLVSSALSLLW